MGPPASVSFQTDLDPPVLSNVTAPTATTQSALTIAFNVGDSAAQGPGGGACQGEGLGEMFVPGPAPLCFSYVSPRRQEGVLPAPPARTTAFQSALHLLASPTYMCVCAHVL